MTAERCKVCDGFQGACDKCAHEDWCLHWTEEDGEDVAVCCDCSGDYSLHTFAADRERDPYPHYDTRKELDA